MQQRHLRVLMEHACIQSSCHQVVGSSDSVDIPRHVQVELLHGDHLRTGNKVIGAGFEAPDKI